MSPKHFENAVVDDARNTAERILRSIKLGRAKGKRKKKLHRQLAVARCRIKLQEKQERRAAAILVA